MQLRPLLVRVATLALLLFSIVLWITLYPRRVRFKPHIPLTSSLEPVKPQSLLRFLQLNPEQVRKLQRIHKRYKNQISGHQKALSESQQKLYQLFVESATVKQLRAQFEQVQRLEQQFDDVQIEETLEIRGILSLEQRHKLTRQMEKYLSSQKMQ
jgi:hypothetical protein